jgi:enoyl-CoA hydratase
VKRDDALALGLATHAVASQDMAALRNALAQPGNTDAIIADFAATPVPPPLAAHRAMIDTCFAQASVPAMLDALDQHAASGDELARKLATGMRAKSPTSMMLACEQITRGAKLDFAQAMATEYRIVSRIMHGHDFYEGVRAVIIDKDNTPGWNPATLASVTPDMISAHFALLGTNELPV